MAFLLKNLHLYYNKLFEPGDPRTTHYPFMESPTALITVLVAYFLFIFKVGPNFMKKREPCNIRKIIMGYDILQILFNFIGVIAAIIVWPYVNFWCTPSETCLLPLYHYLYFLLKCFDLLDTIFFVLRKKFDHITFLHLYHHVSMMAGTWVTCKFVPGGQAFFIGFANVVVHMIMYFYYFLTAYDPIYKKSIWWKKHLTELQITQHCFAFSTFLIPLFNSKCSYPKVALVAYLPAVLLMIYLFVDFYIKAYVKKPTIKATTD